jgi:type IV fimbrial biogenesis protein FimT
MHRFSAVPSALAGPRRSRGPVRVGVATGGFTLVELMVTVAIASIIVALGAPSFLRTLAGHAIKSQAEELQDAVRIGRSEAMKRNGPVVLCRTESTRSSHCAGSGGSWQTWLLFADLAHSGTFVGGDPLLRQHTDISPRMDVTSDAPSVRFEATGIAHSDSGSAVFKLSPKGAASDPSPSDCALQRQVCVNPRGAVAIIEGGATCP